MGELEFKDFTICYQDENGEMKPLTSWNLNKNGLSWTIGTDEEQMEASENIVNNTDTVIEFNPVSISTDTIEAICKGLQKSKEVGISAAEAIEKFAESSKLFYNKEKEKKGEEMDRTIAIVRFWDLKQNKLGSKEYYYFFNPIFNSVYFDDSQRKYWIKNDEGFKYENPVVFKCLIPESCASKEDLSRITKTIVRVWPFEAVKNVKENKGDNNKMNFNKIFPNAEIGKANGVKMSVYGPAFHTYEEREVAFKDGEWIDVTGLTFDFCPAYVCPVKTSEIAVGDFIKHLNCWCRVIGIDGVNITAENITAHEVITILPMKSMFGFDFYSKLITPFGDFTTNMGDMFSNPFMTMMLFGGDSKDFNDMLPLMLMSGGKFDMSNPVMLYFLMRGSKGDKTDGINLNIGF